MSQQIRYIAVCLSTLHDEDRFFFVKALNGYANEKGYKVLVFNSCSDLYEPGNMNNAGEAAVFRLLPYEKLSAVVILSNFLCDEALLKEIAGNSRRHGVPVFSIDKELDGCYSYFFDYSSTFSRLCEHIIRDHGAKDIRMIAGARENVYSQTRIEAFRKALEDNGLPYDESRVGCGNFWEWPTRDQLTKWFDEDGIDVPDAIICANDTMAIAASTFLQQRGIRVPEDCIVTGFDGILRSEYHLPRLTTCRQDYDGMGKLLIESIDTLSKGGSIPEKATVGFHMIKSQSCGCEPVHADNINTILNILNDRLTKSANRQALMCSVQSSVSKMADISELPSVLIDKFAFHTNVFALTGDVFEAPDFGLYHKGKSSYGDEIDVVYQRYFWVQRPPCTIKVRDLFPEPELLAAREEPVIICSVHFMDMVMGYCVFQPEEDFDEYQKFHTLMSAINASLGNFHGRMQIRSINKQLVSVNGELKHLSDHDYMTGLMNRRGFYSELARVIKRKKGSDSLVVVISADLDGLKEINDSYGHLEGDNAITTVARALLSCSVQGEICARFGGDEFSVAAVIPEQKGKAYIRDFKEKFARFISEYNKNSGKPYQVEASIGSYSEILSDYFDVDRMIKYADEKMYANKTERKKARR